MSEILRRWCRGCDRTLPEANFSVEKLLCKTCVKNPSLPEESLTFECMSCHGFFSEDQFTKNQTYVRRCDWCVTGVFNPSDNTEIRTTSSTGGQKGVKLERWDLLPMGPLSHLARHFGRGAEKYDDHQWRNGYEYSKGIAALLRHFSTWIQGNDWDVCPDDFEGCSEVRSDGTPFPRQPVEHGFRCYNHTGNHHLDAVMWHSVVLREFVDTYPEHDDRYKPKKSEPVGDDNIKYVDMR